MSPIAALPLLSETALYPGRGPRNEDEAGHYWGWKTMTASHLLACPTCHAPACEPCRTLDTGRQTAFHVGRYRAVRKTTATHLTAVANALLESHAEVLAIPQRRLTEADHYEIMADPRWSPGYVEEVRWWKLFTMCNLVPCHSCCAPAAEPCRTSKGRLPGRITSTHNSRSETINGPRRTRREWRAEIRSKR
jgi:hypothetical protein